jgi:hypothetical protein
MRAVRALPLLLIALAACTPADDASPPPSPPAAPLAPADTVEPAAPASEALIFDAPEIAIAAFEHAFRDEHVVIVTNASDEAHGVRIEPRLAGRYELLGATTDEPYRVQTDATGIILEIGARTTLVLRRAAAD